MMRDYLAARRRAKQADMRMQYFRNSTMLKDAALRTGQTHEVKLNDTSYSMHFRWHSRAVNYMISTGSLTVMQGGRTVLRTGVTPEKMLYLFTYKPHDEAFPLDGDLP